MWVVKFMLKVKNDQKKSHRVASVVLKKGERKSLIAKKLYMWIQTELIVLSQISYLTQLSVSR